jgi:hypothetical protein
MLRSFLVFLVDNGLLAFSGHLLLWTVIGALSGLLLGVWAYRFLRSRGWYRLDVPAARWWRGLTCALILVLFVSGGTYIGMCEGTWRGVRTTLLEGSLARALVSSLGKVEAMLLVGAYHGAVGIEEHPGITPGEEARIIGEGVDAFLSGRQEISVRDLRRRLDTIGSEVVDQAAVVVEDRVLGLLPFLGESGRRPLLHRVLTGLGRVLAKEPVSAELGHLHLDGYLERLLSELPAEAARQGTVDEISFQELADYLGRMSLATWILDAVRGFLRTQQLLVGGVVMALLALSVGVFGFTRAIHGRICRSRQGRPPEGSIST